MSALLLAPPPQTLNKTNLDIWGLCIGLEHQEPKDMFYLSDILTASEALLLLLLLFVELPSPAESGFSGFFPGLFTGPVVLLNELKFFLICRNKTKNNLRAVGTRLIPARWFENCECHGSFSCRGFNPWPRHWIGLGHRGIKALIDTDGQALQVHKYYGVVVVTMGKREASTLLLKGRQRWWFNW